MTKKIVFVLLTLLILTGAGCRDKKPVVALGDSITYGQPYGPGGSWVIYAEEKTGRKFINRGVGGETTGQMLERFDKDVVRMEPSHVIILGGTNDAIYDVPLQTVQDNFKRMVEEARANKITPIIGLPIPINHEEIAANLDEIRDWLKTYAMKERIQVIDFYTILVDSSGFLRKEFDCDGIHPNEEGYKKMGEAVLIRD